MAAAPHLDRSATPLPRKLGIREGSRVAISGAPEGFELVPMPPGVRLLRAPRGTVDVAVLFVTRRAELSRRFPSFVRTLDSNGRLWVAWPKVAAGTDTDLSFQIVQRAGLDAGLVDNKSASIDGTFQGLQFVYRLVDRPTR